MSTLRAGDIVLHADRTVSKVLAIDEHPGAIHVRFYEGEFEDKAAVLTALARGPLEWTLGHAPMSLEAFDKDLALVTNIPVSEDELDGYRMYLEAMSSGDENAEKAEKPKEGLLAKLARLLGGST